MTRKILHVDMDAFFAQVEQRDHPQYRGRPLVVGSPERRGVVAAASYEARKFGVYSAMPSSIAQQKCDHLIFVSPRFDVYRDVSLAIRAIFARFTELIEPLSLDEAYLDITHNFINERSATRLAQTIQTLILEELNLTCSVGVSYNKFLAKMASGMQKPFGITVITPKHSQAFLEALPIAKFYGVGEQTTKKMHALGIYDGKDLKARSREELKLHFGKAGETYYQCVRGQDDRPVTPNRPTKSVGAEQTYTTDLIEQHDIAEAIDEIIHILLPRLMRENFHGQTLTLKVRFADFTSMTRSKTFSTPIPHDAKLLTEYFWQLFALLPKAPIRLMGLTLQSEQEGFMQQLSLFD
ncbi:DNA polymerase IV [Wohlfahrtiimonas chitiniclastica]|uniref:DNA polymerase IV n=1 Tax=Wohlfahrtiimonas chitiniclastica TaxID=400946 RepID=UPI001BCAFD10|nr:DNA polymerase IV [Wohlfahrtiimonas chitiniclastica]MBS7820252.1 DNA polymerase IV [Wohlfahrtiimonas chitiniclastica]